uniref:Uncharacterized protein n=1 Tax=Rhodosorus marinus TaxID=101924 RepID=A0A7S3A444_9RHOD|mmetsp:Transcript_44108/g.172058  ORF Transcript_44108/g.172058 Transcript_44108/m.172058 type:complete len:396 (+) Transcript_44108:41-1228(+)
MRSFFVLGLLVFVGVVRGQGGDFVLDESRIPACPTDEGGNLTEEFQLSAIRPLCTNECYPYEEGIEVLLQALENGLTCQQEYIQSANPGAGESPPPLTPDEAAFAQFVWDGTLDKAAYENSCTAMVDGERKLCFNAEAVVEIVKANELFCFDPESNSPIPTPSDLSIVLTCDPAVTFRMDSFKPSAELQEQVEAPPPVEDPLQCVVPNGCSVADTIRLYYFQANLVVNLQTLIEEQFTMKKKLFRQKRFVRELKETCGTPDCASILQLKVPVLNDEISQIEDRLADVEVQLTEAQALLDLIVAQLPGGGGAVRIATTLVSRADSGTTWPKCRDRSECDGHIWQANVWINTQCRSICIGYPCQDRLTIKWCLSETLKSGLTNPSCHANAYTRDTCF